MTAQQNFAGVAQQQEHSEPIRKVVGMNPTPRSTTIKCPRCRVDVPERIAAKPGRCMDKLCPLAARLQSKQEAA